MRGRCAPPPAEGEGPREGRRMARGQWAPPAADQHTPKASYPPPPHMSQHPWPRVTFTLRVVVSTSRPGVFVMTAFRALIRPSGEDAMGRSCMLDAPPPPRGRADARSSADACLS